MTLLAPWRVCRTSAHPFPDLSKIVLFDVPGPHLETSYLALLPAIENVAIYTHSAHAYKDKF